MRSLLALILSFALSVPAQAQLVALDGVPLVPMGLVQRQGNPGAGTLSSFTGVDATNESSQMIGQVYWTDGGSHTVDTSGSSSLGWLSGVGTVFANAGSTAKVGLAAVDTAAGPPARAVNSTNVITFDVSADFTGGGGGITASAWQESVPTTGTKTIANGDLLVFAVQFTARAGADVMDVRALGAASNGMPAATAFSGSYNNLLLMPNAVLTASDGTKGYFYGGSVISAGISVTWNSGSVTKEYGNVITLPFPAKVYGIIYNLNAGQNFDVILYSDPLGTPVAEKTISIDLNTVGVATAAYFYTLFPAPYTMTTSVPVAAIIKPTAAGVSVILGGKTYANIAHQLSDSGAAYAVNRASGAFAAQNSGLDRFAVGLLVGAFDAGGGGGSGAHIIGGGN